MKLITFDIEDRMKTLGFYQIAGGILGLFIILRVFIYETQLSGLGILLYALGFGLFTFSIYCGNLLRKGNIKGLKFSLWNQLLQLIQLSISSISFGYYSGIRFAIGFDWKDSFSSDFFLGVSGFNFSYFTNGTGDFSFALNFVPLMVIYSINSIENKIEQRKKLME